MSAIPNRLAQTQRREGRGESLRSIRFAHLCDLCVSAFRNASDLRRTACGLLLIFTLFQQIVSAQPTATRAENPQANRRVFQVKGVIKRVSAAEHRVIVAHEVIPDYMAAMTMPFHVKNTNELSGLKPGDAVTFRYVVLPDDEWIERIERLNVISPPAAASTNRPVFLPLVEPLEPGDRLPPFAFTNHLGKSVTLEDFKGQTLALGFFFTRCPVKELCPRLVSEMAAAAQLMANRANGVPSAQFVCVTLDPAFDTPNVLRSFAEASRLTQAYWQFLTGSAETISRLAAMCGVVALQQSELPQHNLRVVVTDETGRVKKIFPGNAWTSVELAAELTAARTTSSTLPAK
ncbi:MAG: SCO family protein [Verrucomicrobiales bacterium]|nr:SCO family protein [Verrucomicrobiales bacterium]